MDLEAKKGILLSIIAATEKTSVIDSLITMAWQEELKPEKSIIQSEGKEPPKPKHPRKKKITIHGQEYRSLRYACLEIWGLDLAEYNKINKHVREGSDIHDLLAPRADPDKKLLPTDSLGVVLTSQEARA